MHALRKSPLFFSTSLRPAGLALVGSVLMVHGDLRAALDFNKDIRPILSEHCFSCHGFDEPARKAGLRLDTRDGATRAAKSGEVAVVPGQAAKSELVKRITTEDADDLMPPVKHGKPLTPRQIEMLQQWVVEGAPYARHWAFEPLRKSSPPQARS
ncbi:MAG: c-type cytochrome domain-containing protein, partial [Prosthecobacter sp.]|nr:c-type cytochrome domain-containing protein [Prosthecobacter sp.]